MYLNTNMHSHQLSIKKYNVKPWNKKYPDYEVKLDKLKIHDSYDEFTKEKSFKKRLKRINEYLSHCLKVTDGKVGIYPYPDLVFNSLNTTPLDKIKVVILGQDPYIKEEIYDDKAIPQAMGMSFSVPKGIKIPPSLNNIYDNLIKYGHMDNKPKHGNLSFWAYQGVLLLNTALTVQKGCSNSHEKYWIELTDDLIKFISDKTDNVVFVLWGGPSLNKINLIDQKKHKVIISSHPSPLAFNKQLRQYSSFKDKDHFGEINEYLKSKGKGTVVWKIV